MPNYKCYRLYLYLCAYNRSKASCEISVRSLEIFWDVEKVQKTHKVCLIMLINLSWYSFLKKIFLIFKYLYLECILFKFQVVQITASLLTQWEKTPPKMAKKQILKNRVWSLLYSQNKIFPEHAFSPYVS